MNPSPWDCERCVTVKMGVVILSKSVNLLRFGTVASIFLFLALLTRGFSLVYFMVVDMLFDLHELRGSGS